MKEQEDFLEAAVAQATTPHEKIDSMIELAWCLRSSDSARSIKLATKAWEQALSLEKPYPLAVARHQLVQSYIYLRADDFARVLDLVMTSLSVFEDDNDQLWLARACGLLGIVYIQMGNRIEASRTLQKQLLLGRQLGDHEIESAALHHLSLLHKSASQHQQAVEYLQQALFLMRQTPHNYWELMVTLTELAASLLSLQRYSEARIYLDEGLQISLKHQDKVAENMVRQHLGMLEDAVGNKQEALYHYQEALAIAEQHPDLHGKLRALLAIGEMYVEIGQPQLALSYLEKALALSSKRKLATTQYQSHQLLAKAHKALANYEQSLDHFEQFHNIKESVFNQEAEQRVRNLQVIHRTEAAQSQARRLATQNKELEREVIKRIEELSEFLQREKEMAKKLELALSRETELNQLRSRIITTISHEFRTPLTVVSTSAELLTTYFEKLNQEKRDAHHLRIREAIFYLSDLLKDVAFVNQTNTAGVQPTYQTLTFGSCCEQIVSRLDEESKVTDRLEFVFDGFDQTAVVTDPILIKQIVSNLVSNAIKYSPPDQIITVCFERHGNDVSITVADQGDGIPLDEQDKIFDIFYRASNVESKRGLGLGLNIVQQITRELDGKIEVESEGVGLGSRFVVTLPMGQRPLPMPT